MTRIAVSGHRGFSADVAALIDQAVRAELSSYAGDGRTGDRDLAGGCAARLSTSIPTLTARRFASVDEEVDEEGSRECAPARVPAIASLRDRMRSLFATQFTR